jgi:hypothetical protein
MANKNHTLAINTSNAKCLTVLITDETDIINFNLNYGCEAIGSWADIVGVE